MINTEKGVPHNCTIRRLRYAVDLEQPVGETYRCSGTTSNCQLHPRNKNTISICIKPLTIEYPCSGKVDRDVFLTYSLLVSLHWVGSQCSYTDITTIDLVDIPDAAIDNYASPPVVLSLLDRITTQYGAAHASSSIDNQDSPVTLLLQELTHKDIVLKNLESHNGTRENLSPPVYLKDWLKCTKLTTKD
ncbi:unnamed protein product [Musa acuminata subsp. burmannicoides]